MKLGSAFSDNISVIRKQKRSFVSDETNAWWLGYGRALMFTTLVLCVFFILIWRLFDLTIIRGYELRTLSDTNRTHEIIRHAPRGILTDRTGRPLVENIPQYRLLKPCMNENAGQLFMCSFRISKEEGDVLQGQGLPTNWFLEADYTRRYVYPQSTAHVIGYIGEIDGKELENDYYSKRNYRMADHIGRMGAESTYEEHLRGRDGKELVEVDATGNTVRTLGREKDIPGDTVVLSIDAALSEAVYHAFPSKAKGAVIVSKPQTGEILAMYSSPSFSSNDFISGFTQEQYDALLMDPDQPLFNRAIGGAYPPGSTFKLVTLMAGMEEGKVTSNTRIEDIGVLKLGPYEFSNWYFTQYGKTDGMVDPVKAIGRSNDIFFYKAGEAVGITKLALWGRRVGIGKPLGIQIAGEAAGFMPDPIWKNMHFSQPADIFQKNNEWYLGDTYHVAIGQGYLLATPLQVNTWTNIVANGGYLCSPTIEKGTGGKGTFPRCKNLNVKKETVSVITQGMKKACEEGGTGIPFFNFKIAKTEQDFSSTFSESATSSGKLYRVPVACKTGTAEYGDSNKKTHAWFTVFAPIPTLDTGNQYIRSDQEKGIYGEPEISVTVLVEGGGEGSSVAAPIAKKILEEWFRR